MTGHAQPRRLGCTDLAGADHELVLASAYGRVVLVLPAGATAVLDAGDVATLRELIDEQAGEAAAQSRRELVDQ